MSVARISQYILWGLMAVSLVLIGIFFFGGYVEGTEGTTLEEPLITEAILRWAYILLIITLAIAVGFQLFFMFTNPKALKSTGIVLGIAAVIVFISYQLADDTVLNLIQYTGPDNVPKTLKLADTGIIFTSFLGILAIISIIYTAIANIFK